jgi:hypothetical protein
MNIPEVMPTELSGFCDVATGECIVVDTDTHANAATASGSAADDTSQPPEVPDDRPAHAVPTSTRLLR